jgi:hypothetical protein
MVVRPERPGKGREWPLWAAPQAVVETIHAEPEALLPGDGAPEWVVSAEGKQATFNVTQWAFAGRGRTWTSLGVLGLGYGVLPSGPAKAGDYAPLCLYTYENGTQIATEFAWDGGRYRSGDRYELEAGANRPCERALAD